MQIQMYGSDSEREWKIKKHLNVETQRLLEDFTIETKLSVCSVELYSHRQYESIGVQKKNSCVNWKNTLILFELCVMLIRQKVS